MGYECGCDTSAPGFLGTHIQVTGGAGDNFEICNAVNYFSNPGDATPIPDGTPLIYDAALGFFIFDGYMNDAGIMPTLTIKQVDDAGVVIGTPLDAVLTTCMPGVFEINADAVSVDACVGGTDPTFTLGGYSAPTSPANILWTASPGTGVWINNPTALSTTITFQSPGTFTLTVQGIDSHRDCPFSDDIIVNVTDYNATVSISGTDPVCSGSPGTFTYNLTTGTMSDTGISWAVNGVATGDTDFDADITNPGAGTHTITAMGTSPDGCPFTATYELVVVDNPEIDFIMSDTYVCLGDDGFYEVAVPCAHSSSNCY